MIFLRDSDADVCSLMLINDQCKKRPITLILDQLFLKGKEIRSSKYNLVLTKKENFRFIDLFAGIGGMRIAFDKAGGRCVFSSEWNKFSQQTYETNFGDIPDGDITEIKAKDIPNHDILVGGFPCQPFSLAGVSSNRECPICHR